MIEGFQLRAMVKGQTGFNSTLLTMRVQISMKLSMGQQKPDRPQSRASTLISSSYRECQTTTDLDIALKELSMYHNAKIAPKTTSHAGALPVLSPCQASLAAGGAPAPPVRSSLGSNSLQRCLAARTRPVAAYMVFSGAQAGASSLRSRFRPYSPRHSPKQALSCLQLTIQPFKLPIPHLFANGCGSVTTRWHLLHRNKGIKFSLQPCLSCHPTYPSGTDIHALLFLQLSSSTPSRKHGRLPRLHGRDPE